MIYSWFTLEVSFLTSGYFATKASRLREKSAEARWLPQLTFDRVVLCKLGKEGQNERKGEKKYIIRWVGRNDDFFFMLRKGKVETKAK